MRRIATSTRSVDLFGAGKDGFRAGNPAANLLATQLSAAWCNDVQETLLDPIETAGFVPGADTTQLTQAIQALASIGGAISISASTALTRSQRGLVQVNSSAANVDITLPPADRVMDFVIRRVDNTGNRLRVYADGTDMIMHNIEINSAGYGFIRLFGAGDYWVLRSDGAGHWVPVSRLAATAAGTLLQHSANLYPSGGFAPVHGAILIRADYPWLWDLANASGNIDTEANWTSGQWGGYSTGDTATTFRVLELRGEFVRIWDDGHGVDSGRALGSAQSDDFASHHHTIGSSELVAGGSGGEYATSASTGGMATSDTGGSETRPRNIALPMLLKII